MAKTQHPNFTNRVNELYDRARDHDYKVGREDFAEMSGITLGQLNGYLIGQGGKFCETLKTIAKHNDTNVSWLVGEIDDFILNESELLHGLTSKEIAQVKAFIGYLRYMREPDRR